MPKIRHACIAAMMVAAPATAQQAPPVAGAAGTELISRDAAGEVHLLVDPQLSDRRLGLRLVVLNRGSTPQGFGPDAVAVNTDGRAVPLATLAQLLGTGDAEPVNRDTAQAHAAPQMAVTPSGQTDVTGFIGSAGLGAGGVPTDNMARRSRAAPDPAYAAALEKALIRTGSVAPGAMQSGQLFSAPLKRGTKQIEVTVTFAGTAHRFTMAAPRQ